MVDIQSEQLQAAEQSRPPIHAANGSRTAAAGRALLQAVGSDLRALTTYLRSHFRRVGQIAGRKRDADPQAKPGVDWRLLAAAGLFVLLAMVVVAASMLWALRGLPLDNPISEKPGRAVILEASNGEALGRIGSLKIDNVSLRDFPPALVAAVLTTEDKRFYDHFGIDIVGIARAFRRNLEAGSIVQGGSTITQQLVKFRLLDDEQTFARKAREALIAVWLERVMSKDEILERYLNSVYLGAGTYGMPAAARLYFGKKPAELSVAESALLAGLMKAPSRYNPVRDLAAAHQRAAVVLDAMVENGVLSAEDARSAKERPAALNSPTAASPAGTWFADWVREEALQIGGSFHGSVRARTTLDPRLQRIAEQIVRDGLDGNAGRDVSQAALVAMRPDGAVVAMVGGRDYEKSQFNRAVQAKRQPGSAFKLFVYMAALRKGFALGDEIDASAPEIDGWRPENFDNRRYDRLTLAQAFAASVNTAAVNLAMEVGLDDVIAAARELGIKSAFEKLPSLALGSQEVSLLDLTSAYAGVLAGRAPVTPWGVAASGLETQDRLLSITPPTRAQQSLGPVRTDLLRLLRQTVTDGTAQSASLPGFAAGKTGTSQNYRDAWFIGFDESLVVGVWAGNDDGSPMKSVTGGSLPAKMWKTFMVKAGAEQVAGAKEGLAVDTSLRRDTKVPGRERADPDAQRPVEAPAAQTREWSPVQCDFRACAARYRSFRASDCSYQPYGGGPRAICDPGFRREAIDYDPRPQRARRRYNVLDQLRRFD